MTRHMVIWNPAFEAGVSRTETVDTLKRAWTVAAPEMAARRVVELKTSINQELFDKVNAWLMKTWGKSMPKKRPLSIVLISDPVWADSEERWLTACAALSGGYASGNEKPQFCVLSHEFP